MFLDVLNYLYSWLDRIISALDGTVLFTVGTVNISFWENCLGFFVVSIIFSFFLRPREGSVLGTVSNNNRRNNAEIQRQQRSQRGKK